MPRGIFPVGCILYDLPSIMEGKPHGGSSRFDRRETHGTIIRDRGIEIIIVSTAMMAAY